MCLKSYPKPLWCLIKITAHSQKIGNDLSWATRASLFNIGKIIELFWPRLHSTLKLKMTTFIDCGGQGWLSFPTKRLTKNSYKEINDWSLCARYNLKTRSPLIYLYVSIKTWFYASLLCQCHLSAKWSMAKGKIWNTSRIPPKKCRYILLCRGVYPSATSHIFVWLEPPPSSIQQRLTFCLCDHRTHHEISDNKRNDAIVSQSIHSVLCSAPQRMEMALHGIFD